MYIVMCCTPIGREERFTEELRFPAIAAAFAKKAIPTAEVIVATTPDAQVPDIFRKFFKLVHFPFRKYPFALARQAFYYHYTKSDWFRGSAAFVGSDVIFCKPLPQAEPDVSMIATYRYHPAMPYCSDLIYFPTEDKAVAQTFFKEVFDIMAWMPKKIQDSWADQLAICNILGSLNKHEFDGKNHRAQRNSSTLLLPADDFLYTPNDAFPSRSEHFTGKNTHDIKTANDLLNLCQSKKILHFKGNRKHLMIALAYLAQRTGAIDLSSITSITGEDWFFREAVSMKSREQSKIASNATIT